MDKHEVAKIKKAIRLIHHEEKYYEALDILADMVGWKRQKPAFDKLKTKKISKLIEILRLM